MKVFRLTLLTTLLLAGASTRTAPLADQTGADASRWANQVTEPECYLVNGIWVCR